MKLDLLRKAVIEKEVEAVYNEGLSFYFLEKDKVIEHLYGCDGLITSKLEGDKLLRLLIEYKFNEQLENSVRRARILVQVIYYLKLFESNGEVLPNVILVGDKDQCFVMHSNALVKYLDHDADWSIAPSNAHNYCADMVNAIAEDEDVNPFVFEFRKHKSFDEVVAKIKDLAASVQRYVRVTEHNITKVFEYFRDSVIKNANKLDANDLVGVFMGTILDHDNYYRHPTNKNILIAKDKNYHMHGDKFNSFFGYFERSYTPTEKTKFTEIADRLIEDTKRRYNGAFFTPTLFVDYAHKMISEQFGDNWKDEYVVFDPCCGTKNLTRDYRFKELYCSTLEQSELDIAERYNPEATSFQYDFLNDDESKLPQGLLDAFKANKKILFFLNPPYATSSDMRGAKKKGVETSGQYEYMRKDDMGGCTKNIYAQFLYRIMKIKENYNLNDCCIALFCNPGYMSQSSYTKFRARFMNNFKYEKGILFNAGEFSGVSAQWGINFTCWSTGDTDDKVNFNHTLVKVAGESIIADGSKVIYNLDSAYPLSDWFRAPLKEIIKTLKYFFRPVLSSGLKIKDIPRQTFEGSIGSYYVIANDIVHNSQGAALLSSTYTNGNGVSINDYNILNILVAFSARKLIISNWVNHKDEYLAPDETHDSFKQFQDDSIVYSLFNTASNQSSLRDITYQGKQWDIKNEFFWMSKDVILKQANDNYNDELYNDARLSDDRYVYKLLQSVELSTEAQAVLDKATSLTLATIKYRKAFNEEHPNYQINNWDCGFYQLKKLWELYDKKGFLEFKELYKALADKMRPMVYELGMLRN